MSLQSQQIDHPVYIDNSESLEQFCQQWSQAEFLTLDTEFIRTDTFYPIGALIQVSDGKGCFLIDPLAIEDFSAFKQILIDDKIIKVLHSCSEDLEVFDRLLGVLPQPLIDTQIAAGLDGLGFSMGYQRLTEALLQIHVPKGETRSNWLQRPLTNSQIHYAALDVAYLPKMYRMLRDSLQAKGRWSWLVEECQGLAENYRRNSDIELYYQKVKSVWKLSRQQLAVLQALTLWREQQARKRDKPRGRILKDKSCHDIARWQPADLKALSRIEDVGPKTLRQDGETILGIVQAALDIDEREYPQSLPKPLPPQTGTLLKRLKAHVGQRADHLQLAQELLVKKRDYEALLRSGMERGEYKLPESLGGWREDVIGRDLLAIIQRES